MTHKVGDFITYNDGDIGPRSYRIVEIDPDRVRLELRRGTATKLWVKVDSPRIQTTPVHHLHRTQDRPTAVAAAQQVKAGSGKMKVLLALFDAGDRGLLDDDHEAINGLGRDSAGKRRGELLEGYDPPIVRDSGMVRKTRRNSNAAVWCLTDVGYALVHRLRARGAA